MPKCVLGKIHRSHVDIYRENRIKRLTSKVIPILTHKSRRAIHLRKVQYFNWPTLPWLIHPTPSVTFL